MTCTFIPPFLLEHLSSDEASRTLSIDASLRSARQDTSPEQMIAGATGAAWEVHTADHGSTLPGALVRAAGEPPVGDESVNQAATGVEGSLSLFSDLGRSSYDGKGAAVIATVHYEQGYDNAFWDGKQLVFGDGDGQVFGSFTKPIDVCGHEFTHAVTQYTANLTYSDQSGALNESISDCFGSCVKQRALGQDAASADWLIGEGIFEPGVQGVGLRSMKAPGTAYDDPRIGKDPQVASMSAYVHTTSDNGGVHINSGIPNHAFYLAAVAIGGLTWEGAGRIWYAALTSGLAPDTDFAGFAAACIGVAGPHAAAVRDAWSQVGVDVASSAGPVSSSVPGSSPAAASDRLDVVRSGGVAGVSVRGSLDLSLGDDRAAEARALLARVDLAAAATGTPQPDRFVYEFSLQDQHCLVHEGALTPELRRLAELALD
jgi:Zn-dependent metalloprotease